MCPELAPSSSFPVSASVHWDACNCRHAEVQVCSPEIQCVGSECGTTHTHPKISVSEMRERVCDHVSRAVPLSIFLWVWLSLHAAEPWVLLQREVIIYRNSQNASWHAHRPLASLAKISQSSSFAHVHAHTPKRPITSSMAKQSDI